MPSARISIFRMPQRVEIVLVPFDHGAVFHRRVFDRHQFLERAARDDEAADMLRQMAREADQLARQSSASARVGSADRARARAHASARSRRRTSPTPCRRAPPSHPPTGPAPCRPRGWRGAGDSDHGRRQRGAVAAVFLVDVLDDLLAPLMLEIDVDVGRLVAFLVDEALEQHVDPFGIDRGDAEAEAHHRIGRRAAPLAQNSRAGALPSRSN